MFFAPKGAPSSAPPRTSGPSPATRPRGPGGGYSLAALSRLLLDAPPKVPLLELFGRAR